MGNGKYHTEGMQSTARCYCYPTDLNATSQFSRKTDKTTAEAGFNWQMEFSTSRAVDSTERAVKTHIHTYPIFFWLPLTMYHVTCGVKNCWSTWNNLDEEIEHLWISQKYSDRQYFIFMSYFCWIHHLSWLLTAPEEERLFPYLYASRALREYPGTCSASDHSEQ